MPVLEKISEYRLKSGDKEKTNFTEDPAVLGEMEKVRGAIEQVLQDTGYFHGTGRKHYGFKGDSQYEGIDHSVVVDNLEPLVKDGLLPQKDLYAEIFTGDGNDKTVSLSKNRMYARVYADLHMNENDPYQYEYGSQAFWWEYLLRLMLITGARDKNERKAVYAQKKSELKLVWNSLLDKMMNLARKGQKIPVLSRLFNVLFILGHLYFKSDPLWKIPSEDSKKMDPRKWIGRYRKDCGGVREEYSRRRKERAYNKFMKHGKSDIDGNYGIIIGIGKGKVQKKEIKRKPVSIFETRGQNTLTRDTWSYIEVPLTRVQETRRDLQKVLSEAGSGDLEIPVFATEHVEMVMREKSLAELAAKDES